ncbi:hypothetical protein [Botrimarina mediterranea]|uniref:hypothetical protein n=1 Tax=Botrimarina mediterranea TaxID=2528022 RepID=UPI001188044A|nr:hypothetical protein K2D_16510 [Planctomycetes bacterium K2D]
MKPSRLTPKAHPDNPYSTMPPRSKPMNRRPPTEPAARKKFRKGVWLCQCCGKRFDRSDEGGQSLECHEMASGGSRTAALEHPECLLMLCGVDLKRGLLGCHKVVQDWPLDKQLALKKWSDPERYDRLLVLKVKRVASTFVTEEEVDARVEELKRHGVGPWLNQ